MSLSNDLTASELSDEIENIFFLCDRLNKRLAQITSYVDEIQQTWTGKRRTFDSDSNVSPINIQKAIKCNKVLLHVAEKLAVVELQTELLNNLYLSSNDIAARKDDKQQVPLSIYPSTPNTNNHTSIHTVPTNNTSMPTKIEPISNEHCLQQDISFDGIHSLNLGTKSLTRTFNTRNTVGLSTETVTMKSSIENLNKSAFHRPLTNYETNNVQQAKLSPQNPVSYSSVKQTSNNYQKVLSHSIDIHSSPIANETNINEKKIRIKMQVVQSGTIWRNADIPIVDHPSAFFVSNQDPRVVEQFHMMSIQMNHYYSNPENRKMPLQNISIGDFCITRFSEDQLWYRARVVLNNNESVLVVFIDYGNSESKSPSEIYPLVESLTRLPAMTVACTLNEAFPSNREFWTPEAIDAFNMIVKNRIVEVHFQQTIEEQWPLHFVRVMVDGQPIAQHPKLAPHVIPTRNEQIALHFNDKLTPMEYILYNVAVVESDIYNSSLQ